MVDDRAAQRDVLDAADGLRDRSTFGPARGVVAGEEVDHGRLVAVHVGCVMPFGRLKRAFTAAAPTAVIVTDPPLPDRTNLPPPSSA